MTAEKDLPPIQKEWRPSYNPWLIAISVMLATFMEVLDTSIANVALPHIAGNLSATTDEATWVLTSYLVSNAIVLPATGWFGIRFGRKRFLLACIAFFSIASATCGAAPSLGALIVARIIQGAAGGALQPISQSVLMESFPPAKRGVAMAAFSMGVVVAPIIGPTLGGWLTDNYTWRWIFYINVPVGILAFYLCQMFLEDPPYLIAAKRSSARIDYVGFSFMAIWLATLQIILDKGQRDDWFAAPWIRWTAAISFISMVVFIIWELFEKEPIVELRALKDRNFAVGTALVTLVGVVLYSTITLQPLMVQDLMGYTAFWSGVALTPRGIGAIIAVFFVGRVIGRLDSRKLIACGFLGLAYSSYMLSKLNLQIAIWNIFWPNLIMGLAMGLIFVPLATLTMAGLPNVQMGNATGIFNLMRNIGGSFGISIVTTMLARGAQRHQTYVAAHFNPYNPVFQRYFAQLKSLFTFHGISYHAGQKALLSLYNIAVQQSTLLAYMGDFRFLAFCSLLCVPAALALRKLTFRKGPPMGAH
ncbi:MAG: DHA2 family efflux MFS transporter permease subunit [Deltaproteobacteria bacterium]|nr:DHA2 family efflux MFS transporter permease subunit [Deltaproteobacteria bacterium]MDA8308369.1 DHA2 family efflux MFS transporter permease subunit [Deltaproteobacteria bacterium]